MRWFRCFRETGFGLATVLVNSFKEPKLVSQFQVGPFLLLSEVNHSYLSLSLAIDF